MKGALSLLMLLIKINENPDKFKKNKFVAEVNTGSKIRQGLWSLTFGRKEQWYWEQSGLDLSPFLLPSFFLTASKEVQF